jgi:hypothetical protein
MKLHAFRIDGQPLAIRPAPFERPWMDSTNERYAYRCLPLNIANAHGWELLCPAGFTAVWRGDPALDALWITPDPGTDCPAMSHFGHGILTFHVPAIFRTEPGYDFMVQGPINRPKDGIYALSGVVETDWAPFTFTMNWMFTRPGVVRFEKGEPFCHLFPIKRGELESMEPELHQLSDNPELKAEYEAWSASRAQFNADLKTPNSKASAEKWQKHYYRGQNLKGEAATLDEHRTRVRVKPFRKLPSDPSAP